MNYMKKNEGQMCSVCAINPSACRGMCKRCYNRDYTNKNRDWRSRPPVFPTESVTAKPVRAYIRNPKGKTCAKCTNQRFKRMSFCQECAEFFGFRTGVKKYAGIGVPRETCPDAGEARGDGVERPRSHDAEGRIPGSPRCSLEVHGMDRTQEGLRQGENNPAGDCQ